jgi:hypothetical protein
MEAKDKKRFVVGMAVMGECFQKEPSETMSDIYWKVLQNMDIKVFEDACLTLVNTRKITGTFPLVAEIRDAAGGGAGGMALKTITAWDKLMYAIQHHAPYDSVQFDDPVIYHIVRQLGGWTEMGDWPAEETKWKCKEFERLYEAYASSDTLPEPDGHLVGLTEAENRDKAPDFVPKPFMISGTTGNFKATQHQESVQITHHGPRRLEGVNLQALDKTGEQYVQTKIR